MGNQNAKNISCHQEAYLILYVTNSLGLVLLILIQLYLRRLLPEKYVCVLLST